MTTPTTQDDTKMTAAKVLFLGFFAAALGWAGVLVAAVAVATEQAWTGGRGEGQRAAARRGSWLDKQQSWLAQDHQDRVARNQAEQKWLDDGAPASTAPVRPSKASRFGRGLHRLVASVALAGRDMARGARDGWAGGDEARRNGAGFRGIVGAARKRPDSTPEPVALAEAEDPEPTEDDDEPLPDPSTDIIHDRQVFTATVLASPSGLFAWSCRNCPGKGFDFPTKQAAADAARRHHCTPATQPAPAQPERKPVTQPDSNATVLARKLAVIDRTVTAMSADVDELNTVVATLRQRVTAAADLAHLSGMPTETITAVDSAAQAATQITARLDDFATAATEASSSLTQATAGLAAVHHADDQLRQVGADGRALDTAAA